MPSKILQAMKNPEKSNYVRPLVEVFVVKTEGVICDSGSRSKSKISENSNYNSFEDNPFSF